MTSPLDEKGPRPMNYIEQAITDFWGERCDPTDDDCPTCQAWAEYDRLSTTPAPDELEVVAWRHTLRMDGGETAVRLARAEVDRPWGKPGIDFDSTFNVTIEPLVRASQAHSTIAALRAEKDKALEWAANEQVRAETAEAEVKRLTEDNEALRDGLSEEGREIAAGQAWDFVKPGLVAMNQDKGPAGVWSAGFRSGWDAAARATLNSREKGE